MNAVGTIAALAVLGVLVQIAFPGRDVYNAGWFNVVLAALAIWTLMAIRRASKALPTPRERSGAWLAGFGVAAIAFAGVASGLLGPAPRSVIGAPGSTVPDPQLGGALVFPLASEDAASVLLQRGGGASAIGAQRYTVSALLRSIPRPVISIQAHDAHGGHLTITQPSGSVFLSPVLLLEQRQTIDGLSLPYDSFALPAVHRIVKAVYFSAQEAASMPALAHAGGPVVLFDLEDDTGASLRDGIGMARDGQTIALGGVEITPTVLSYPAIEILSIPDLAVVGIGLAAIAGGLLLTRMRQPG
jgi:hypothetical protein